MDKDKMQTLSAARDAIEGNRLVLREYARRVIIEKDETLTSLEDLMGGLMEEYLSQGRALHLTHRDLVVLLYKGVLD